jgi:hypothetical protein
MLGKIPGGPSTLLASEILFCILVLYFLEYPKSLKRISQKAKKSQGF